MKFSIKYSYLLLFYPVFILSLIVNSFSETGFLPERVIFAYLILYAFALLISNKAIKYSYIILIYFLTLVISFIEASYVFLYNERFTDSTAYIFLETNSSEVGEYLSEYIDVSILVILFCFLIPSFFILKGVKKAIYNYTLNQLFIEIKQDIKKLFTNKYALWIKTSFKRINSSTAKKNGFVLILITLLTFFYFKDGHIKYHAAYQFYEGYESYQAQLKQYNQINTNNNIFKNITSKRSKEIKETFVLIIGESTTKNHMNIYNYSRNTTPKLNELKNELVVFNDVISPHSHTISSLEKVLTLGNYESPEKKYQGSVIQMMKEAGYKTYWISNQIPIGIYETMVTTLAKKSDYSYFLNFGAENKTKSLDEKVLPYLNKVLDEKVNKKFIIIHLLGTHTLYENRYPKSFNKFKDVPNSNFPSEKSNLSINHYDNAILYNDYMVSSIITKVKIHAESNEIGQVLYLSDHGEDVYETVDFSGHSESIGSRPMYQIPFIYWTNIKEKINVYQAFKDRRYMTDDLIHSISDLNGLSFLGNDSTRSLFSLGFKDRVRIIKNGVNFDE